MKKATSKNKLILTGGIIVFIIGFMIRQGELNTPKTTSSAVAYSINSEASNITQPETSFEIQTTTPTTTSPVKTEASNISTEPLTSNTASSINYKTIEVYGGDISGYRESNVKVDVGFGHREYWAYTNEFGQLVKVEATEIILQNDSTEPVTSAGRYYSDEAKVPGTESSELDEGHVIADSLGGVSNAYNITPQNSTLNRHGDQAYMEKVIRDAGGCTDFLAIITYPNTTTQIPSHYYYKYNLNGSIIEDSFDNINPDTENEKLGLTSTTAPIESKPNVAVTGDVSKVDTNGNGTVTIAEAKAAGFKMPITSSHWLYKYMIDKDKDGQVGE